MSTTPTIYFIELNTGVELPLLVEVHKSFDGAADAVSSVREQIQIPDKLDEAYEALKATAGELTRGRDEYKEVFDSAKIVPCAATPDGVANFLIRYGLNDRDILDQIIVPPFMQFVREAPENGYMAMSDVYKVFSYISLMGVPGMSVPAVRVNPKDVN